MKYLNKITSVLFLAVLGVLTLTGCEGGDLYKVGAPNWLDDKINEIADSKKTTIVSVTPNPTELGKDDLSQDWWSVFTDDVKIEPGTSAQVKFMNYGGGSNWNNFVIILRNEAKDKEYGVFRADNWCWSTDYPDGAESNYFCTKKMENDSRDWGAWLKSMSMAKCTATISNPGDGSASISIVMLGSDGATYTQEYKDISGVDKDNLYFAFTVDHSYIEFGDIDIVDSEPVSMTLVGVPSEVLIGTTLKDAMANVTATVTFESGATKDITAEDLQFEAIPDYDEIGQKTLVAIYSKTFLGKGSEKAIIASKTFSLVKELSAFAQTFIVPEPQILGKEDNTSAPWYENNTNHYKIEPKETKVFSFTNYTAGMNNWDNFLIRLTNQAWASYCVVRADDFGWDGGYAACTHTYETGRDWAGWLPAMNGAKVTAYVTNNGDGTADIKLVMVGNNNLTYTQDYIGINTINPDDLWVDVCVENAHVVFDATLGNADCTTAWWTAFMPNIKVIPHQVCTVNFTNYTSGVENWNNFAVVLNKGDLSLGANGEYAVVRADDFGWGNGYAACTHTYEGGRDWAGWKAAMNGAKVKLMIVNNGDGTADIKATMTGNNGLVYTQDYIGINTIDPDDFYFRIAVDNSYLVFE